MRNVSLVADKRVRILAKNSFYQKLINLLRIGLKKNSSKPTGIEEFRKLKSFADLAKEIQSIYFTSSERMAMLSSI